MSDEKSLVVEEVLTMRNILRVVLLIIFLLFTGATACGSSDRGMSPEEVVLKGQEFYQIIDDINYEFQNMATSEDYLIINGCGKKIIPSEVVDYSALIEVMDELQPYCYFTLLDSFLEESGYDTFDNLKEAHNLFFSLSSQEKSKVLSCMFKSLGEEDVSKDSDVDIKTEIFILRAFTLIDKSTGAEIPLNDG